MPLDRLSRSCKKTHIRKQQARKSPSCERNWSLIHNILPIMTIFIPLLHDWFPSFHPPALGLGDQIDNRLISVRLRWTSRYWKSVLRRIFVLYIKHHPGRIAMAKKGGNRILARPVFGALLLRHSFRAFMNCVLVYVLGQQVRLWVTSYDLFTILRVQWARACTNTWYDVTPSRTCRPNLCANDARQISRHQHMDA